MTRQNPKATPTAAETLVEAIRILHSIATPAAEIAKRLHIDQATVLYVIEWGTLPPRQLPLLWDDEALASGEATGSSCGFQVGNLEIPVAEVDRWRKLRAAHGVFQLGEQDADEPQAKTAPTVRHFLWWLVAVIGTAVSL